jgi:hypothetical protein
MKVQLSLACFPGLHVLEAAAAAASQASAGTLTEPGLGELGLQDVQLVPQNLGLLDEVVVDGVQALLPNSRLRLHANVRLLDKHRFADLARFERDSDWWARAAQLSRHLGCASWSAHSGARADCSLGQLLDNTRRATDLMGGACRVAVEGQYPTSGDRLLVSHWAEYEELLGAQDVDFAIDLSHLNIVVRHHGRQDALVRELLRSPRCAEVHLSANDGRTDAHRTVDSVDVWWMPMLADIHRRAVVFSEGNRLRASPSHPSPTATSQQH